jgi:hypothetical protein
MASPLDAMMETQGTKGRPNPKTVLAVKGVDLVLVTYTDDSGQQYTQLAVAGDQNVHLIDGKMLGFNRTTTPQGQANNWLRDGIFEKLGRKAK